MKIIYAFYLGMKEFRQNFTTETPGYLNAYERGRDLAHRLTLRKYEDT